MSTTTATTTATTPATAAKRGGKAAPRSQKRGRLLIWVFLAPTLIGLGIF
jgi:multiple sugar transport system permease protein